MDELSTRIASLSPEKRALLELRLRRSPASAKPESAIKARAGRSSARASFAQQRLWFLEQLEPGQAAYNVPRAIRLSGRLDIQALRATLAELVRRHEPFRTHFVNVDGELRQIIRDDVSIPLTQIDLTSLSETERAVEHARLTKEDAALPFDLNTGPVIRTTLLRLGQHEHVLLLTTHHIVSDAWSAVILFRELAELYKAFAAGSCASLAPLAIQYADFAEWQHEWLRGEALDKQVSYWKKQLDGVSELTLPLAHPRPARSTFHGAFKSQLLSPELSQQLSELSNREGTTVFMTLLAAFKTLLFRYTSQEDIVVGSPIAGRNRAEIEDLIGFFINTLALRTSLAGDPTFRELLQRVKQAAIDAYTHQDLPFEKLVAELDPERDLSRNPLFQVMFQYQNLSRPLFETNDLKLTWLESPLQTAKFDLSMLVVRKGEVFKCVIDYRTEVFEEETIERLLTHYTTLLESIVANPDQRIAALRLTTKAERDEMIAVGRGETSAFPNEQTIHQLFEQQVERTPEQVAIISRDQRMSYRELNARANQVANYLHDRGVRPEVRVAVRMERSPELITCLLGVLKAGGAYVPIDPGYPDERASFILEDSGAKLLLTLKEFIEARGSAANPLNEGGAQNAAHVIYTSGSTGKPKGVISAHRASLNRFAWMWRTYPFVAGEVCCQKTSVNFVDSIWEIFGPLLQGVPLVVLEDECVKDQSRLVASLSEHKVSRIVLVPSLLRFILESDQNLAERLSHLRYCFCSGEALPADLASAFRERLPHTKLINLYGSSEVAADVTCYEVTNVTQLSNVPIGKPIANTQVYILDSLFEPVPYGVIGEIYVGGEALARGYLNQPALTREKFVSDPFNSGTRQLFRTGDLGRFLADGNIEFHGRRDHQVKIRGVRIELGEIETVLKTDQAIKQAVVVARDESGGGKQLVAYLVVDRPLAINELRMLLRRKLPDYMVPAAFVLLEALPLNTSGKVDRLALPPPSQNQSTTEEDFVAPRTPVEDVLASIWADTLAVEHVSINDDFFSLGGHSLLVARIVARVREALQVELPMRTLFEASTVAALAAEVEKLRQTTRGLTAHPLARVARKDSLPLSFSQERLWFFDQVEPQSAAYNIPRAVRLRGPLNRDALQQSFNQLVNRQEVLRTIFINNNGTPALAIKEHGRVEIQHLDLRHLPEAEREQKSRTIANEETKRPFDLTQAPLLRAMLVQLDENAHVLLLTIHHIISDGWSIGVLLRELAFFYNSVVGGTKSSLPDLPVQYVDFAAWQRRLVNENTLSDQVEYWVDHLSGAPATINLPTDRPRPAVRSFRGAKHSVKIAKAVKDSLTTLGREHRATLFMTLLTAFHMLLACITGDEDIVVGSPIAGRTRRETENVIGNFINTLLLRATFSGDPDFNEMLQRVRDIALGAFNHQDVPFEKLLLELQPVRTLSHNPLFQVWFVLQNAQAERAEFVGLTTESLAIESEATRHDLQLTLWETADGLEGAFHYSTDLFDPTSIAQVEKQFQVLLAAISAHPESRLSALRASLATVVREYREELSEQLADSSRRKFKSVKRKGVGRVEQTLVEDSWTTPTH